MNKYEKWTCIVLCIIFVSLQFYRIIPPLFDMSNPEYTGYNIPDMMINYQGGFVRRGLLGELMFQLYCIFHYPIYNAIVWIDTIVFIIIFVIMGKAYLKMKYFPIMHIALCEGVLGFRRDFLMLLLAIFIFNRLFKYIAKRRNFDIIIASLTATLAVFLYEPAFFFIVPMSMFILWNFPKDKHSASYRIKKCIVPNFLPIVAMALVCISKGNQDTAERIWASWQPMLERYGETTLDMPKAIQFLTFDSAQVMLSHFRLDYGIDLHSGNIDYLQLCAGALFLIGFYFLTIQMPRIQNKDSETATLSDVFLFQFICLIPMFTILSCDVGRTINYVITTSFYITYLMEKYSMHFRIPYIQRVSDKICSFLTLAKVKNKLYLYILVLAFVPFGLTGPATIDHPFYKEFEPIFLPKIQLLLSYMGL